MSAFTMKDAKEAVPLKVCSAVRHGGLCMTLQKTEKVKSGNAQCETALRIWMASFYGEGAGWRGRAMESGLGVLCAEETPGQPQRRLPRI